MIRILSPRTLRKRSQARALPEPVVPAEPYRVDCVVPFWSGDAKWMPEAVEGLLAQRHVLPTIHVIADGCEFPTIPTAANVIQYRTNKPPGRGPYRLTNALVRHGHCKTDWLALQDADDVSYPDRLWQQVSIMEQAGAQMISSAMQNQADDESMRAKRGGQSVVSPGAIYASVPRGRCVNSTRTVSLKLFRKLKGFQNLTCSGDFEFDNRVRFSGIARVVDCQAIHAMRRLHSASLSHGIAPLNSPARREDFALLTQSLKAVKRCRNCAPNFGAMMTAFELEVV